MLLLLLACALSLGGWVLVAPAIATRTATAPEPAIDLDAAASGARLAMPRTPDRPLPSHAPVAAAASSDAADKARCGDDQRAVYKEPQADPDDGMVHLALAQADPDGIVRHMPGEIKPAGVGYTGAQRRIDAALRASADPFDRAMADWLDLDQIAPPALRADALVTDALAVTDPRVYGLAYVNCHPWLAVGPNGAPPLAPTAACARLSATQWARLDPGNAVPWLWALQDADRRGDEAAQREALRSMAASSRMDVHFHAGAAAVARLGLPDADLAAQLTATTQALGTETTPGSPLIARCRERSADDAELASACSRIAELLYDHSDSLIWHALGGALHKVVTGDASWLDRAHQEQRSMAPARPAVADTAPCGGQRDFLRTIVRMDAVGELQLAREARHAASAP